MRRTVLALAAGAAIVLSFALATRGTSAAPAPSAHGFIVTGSVAGGVTSAESGQPLTFAFSEKSTGSTPQSEDLVLESLTHASLVSIGCVEPNGSQINADGNACEPGFLSHGQSASAVYNATITGTSGNVAARLCLSNEGTGVVGPCVTLTVHLV
ncbi:MAG TPA: hypothetical protein VMU65_14865 [Candidatus Saccharimonadales bacterium]|nr:hypothetical protein [Candidatus Saccharimonadales bacterium]